MKNIRSSVLRALQDVATQQGSAIDDRSLDNDFAITECGLDSLGFAILVSELEIRLGYDPFVLMDTPFYPKTIGELIAVYERFGNRAKS